MTGRKINVLFMQSQSYFGADSMIHRLIMENLDREEFEVHVACDSGDEGSSPALTALRPVHGLHVRPTDFGPTANSRTPGEIARQAVVRGPKAITDLTRLVAYTRRHGIDIVHGTEKPRDAFYGLLLSRLTGARCVVHLHVKAEDWISPLSRWAMRRADALIGVSDFVSESLMEMGHDRSRVHTVLNALDPSKWQASTPDASVREEFGIARNDPLLVTASRLFPWKGQSELLRALHRLRQSGRRFHLLVVGEDDPRATPGGGSYLQQLRALAEDRSLDDVVTFTGFRTDVRRLMNACDIFAMPSFEEPFGVVYAEAMALGKPVIGLDNGGTREVVRQGITGLLSAPGDIDGLATNIGRLLEDATLREAMGAAGRRRVMMHFSPERLAADVASVYRTVVADRRTSPSRLAVR